MREWRKIVFNLWVLDDEKKFEEMCSEKFNDIYRLSRGQMVAALDKIRGNLTNFLGLVLIFSVRFKRFMTLQLPELNIFSWLNKRSIFRAFSVWKFKRKYKLENSKFLLELISKWFDLFQSDNQSFCRWKLSSLSRSPFKDCQNEW